MQMLWKLLKIHTSPDSTGASQEKAVREIHENPTCENQEKAVREIQENGTCENQEKSTCEIQENSTSENQEKEPTPVIGRRTRDGCSGSWSSQEFSALTAEDEEGIEECSSGEVLLDSSRSVESPGEVLMDSSRSVESPGDVLLDSLRSVESPGEVLLDSSRSVNSPGEVLLDSSRSVESPSEVLLESSRSVKSPREVLLDSSRSVKSPGEVLLDSSRSVKSPEEVLLDSSRSVESPGEVVLDISRSVESETTSSKASTSDSEDHHPSFSSQWSGFFGLLRKGSGIRFQTFHSLRSVPKLTRKKTKRIRGSTGTPIDSSLDAELCHLKSTWKNFSLLELQAATNGFSPENLIGQGGYAEVYRGEFEEGQLAAIKRLTRGSPEEMTMDFLSELGIIVHVDHPNIAKLIGYGVEGGMHLVLELSAHGSLASLLYASNKELNWDIRYKVAVGTAEGLAYLHEGCHRRIIHKDIKASNILLTEDFEAQISDFGLAKWLPDQWTHHTVSKVEGTFGYLPPEFFMHGVVDEKTDVYAYGVLLLELITGRQALDSSQKSLVMWAKPLIKKNSVNELVDPALGDAYNSHQLNRLALTALMCVHHTSSCRPQMSEVVENLKSPDCTLEFVDEDQNNKRLLRTYSKQLLDSEESNTTKYLNDLNRHMEIVLGGDEL